MTEQFFETLADEFEPAEPNAAAPSTLKSRLYSALTRLQALTGPLLSLAKCHSDGRGLCVFEHIVRIAPLGEAVKSMNPCSICHARALAERVERAPIFWPHCPYVDFQEN
jgi:hypothetical protein